MRTPPFRRSTCAAILLAACSTLAGCDKGAEVGDYVPESSVGQTALKAALEAWKGGQAAPATIENATPKVEVVDSQWLGGARLTDYEILGELPNESPAQYNVKLTIEGEAAPVETVYVVVGQDPLWVFRQADYVKTGGM